MRQQGNRDTSSYLSSYNFFIYLDGLFCKEWRVASCHFIDQNSQRPPVHCFVVALIGWTFKNIRDIKKIRDKFTIGFAGYETAWAFYHVLNSELKSYCIYQDVTIIWTFSAWNKLEFYFPLYEKPVRTNKGMKYGYRVTEQIQTGYSVTKSVQVDILRWDINLHTLLRMISGARYSGVPHSVHVLPFTLLANPKSVTWKSGNMLLDSILSRIKLQTSY